MLYGQLVMIGQTGMEILKHGITEVRESVLQSQQMVVQRGKVQQEFSTLMEAVIGGITKILWAVR